MHYNGKGVQQDHAEAQRWIRSAAKQGIAEAQFRLGTMHLKGEGADQDYAEAMRCFRLAADQGHAGAQFNLGVMHAKGVGVAQDFVAAHMWMDLAATRCPERAERYTESRDLVAGELSATQIADALERARTWRPRTWSEIVSGAE